MSTPETSSSKWSLLYAILREEIGAVYGPDDPPIEICIRLRSGLKASFGIPPEPVPRRDTSGRCLRETLKTWPPLEGWGFIEGKFSFDGDVFDLKGQGWRILKALAEAKGQVVPLDELRKIASGDYLADESAIRHTVRRLRDKLAELLRWGEDEEIIVADGGGYRLRVG